MMDSPDRMMMRSSTSSGVQSPDSVTVDLGVRSELLPELEQIEKELKSIVKQSAAAKASYKTKLVKMNTELKENDDNVKRLEAELVKATKKRDAAASLLEEAKEAREQENQKLQIRKLNLEIQKLALENTSTRGIYMREIDENETFDSKEICKGDLDDVRKKLEDIHQGFVVGRDKAASTKFVDRKVADDTLDKAIHAYVDLKRTLGF